MTEGTLENKENKTENVPKKENEYYFIREKQNIDKTEISPTLTKLFYEEKKRDLYYDNLISFNDSKINTFEKGTCLRHDIYVEYELCNRNRQCSIEETQNIDLFCLHDLNTKKEQLIQKLKKKQELLFKLSVSINRMEKNHSLYWVDNDQLRCVASWDEKLIYSKMLELSRDIEPEKKNETQQKEMPETKKGGLKIIKILLFVAFILTFFAIHFVLSTSDGGLCLGAKIRSFDDIIKNRINELNKTKENQFLIDINSIGVDHIDCIHLFFKFYNSKILYEGIYKDYFVTFDLISRLDFEKDKEPVKGTLTHLLVKIHKKTLIQISNK